jgi:ribosomal protein S18 acetylase RimI-like enzyme
MTYFFQNYRMAYKMARAIASLFSWISFLPLWTASLLCGFSVEASQALSSLAFSEVLQEINTSLGIMTICRPNLEEVQRTASTAKSIFIEAFSTTYTEYHRQSGSTELIEKWLRLRPEMTLHSWLSAVFDDEYEEYLTGRKAFVYLCDSEGALIGWLSHSPVSEKGELYLSQCSLEAGSRNHKVATAAFQKAFKGNYIKQLFPDVKQIKLIARKINTIAYSLYTKAGFIVDETIDPAVYGDSYDDRYVGFRLDLSL